MGQSNQLRFALCQRLRMDNVARVTAVRMLDGQVTIWWRHLYTPPIMILWAIYRKHNDLYYIGLDHFLLGSSIRISCTIYRQVKVFYCGAPWCRITTH